MVGLQALDWIIIGLYFALLLGVVWWSSRKLDTSEDYFLAGRNVGFFAVGASLFASNIGSEHIVGLAGSGAETGMAMAHYELHAWIMVLLAWIFVPFYYNSKVFTMPQFLEKRFSSGVRSLLSVVSIIAYVFTKVSVTVYAGAKVFETLLPEMQITMGQVVLGPFVIGAVCTVVLTGLYTIFGGLRAVVYTDTAQAIILIVGSAFITFFGLSKLGGWGELQTIIGQKASQFELWRPMSDPEFPWLGIMIASPIVGIWYWCTDQYIVQRTLAAKNLTSSRRGALWGGFLKVWPVFIFLVPGIIGYALHQKGLIAIPTEANGTVDGDQVFPTMVATLLPQGLRGLVVGGLLAALMSSLSSLFNSTASLFTVDIYEKIRPQASERELVHMGRIATGVVVVLGLIWIPVMPLIADKGLYHYLQSVQGFLAPPITAVFLLGIFWKRINANGALWGLALGFILGMAKLTIQIFFGAEKALQDPAFLAWLGDLNFLYFSGVLFVVSIAIIFIASYLTSPPPAEKLEGLTYSTVAPDERKTIRQSWNKVDVILTVVVLGLVLGVYIYFSFWI